MFNTATTAAVSANQVEEMLKEHNISIEQISKKFSIKEFSNLPTSVQISYIQEYVKANEQFKELFAYINQNVESKSLDIVTLVSNIKNVKKEEWTKAINAIFKNSTTEESSSNSLPFIYYTLDTTKSPIKKQGFYIGQKGKSVTKPVLDKLAETAKDVAAFKLALENKINSNKDMTQEDKELALFFINKTELGKDFVTVSFEKKQTATTALIKEYYKSKNKETTYIETVVDAAKINVQNFLLEKQEVKEEVKEENKEEVKA